MPLKYNLIEVRDLVCLIFFSFKLFTYFWLCWVFVQASLVAINGGYSLVAWASHYRGSSCGKVQALGAWASVIVAHELSWSETWGVFPGQRSNPISLALAGRFLSIVPPGKSVLFCILRLNSTLYIVGTQQIVAEWWSGLCTIPEGRETNDLLCWGPYCLSCPSRVDFIAEFIQMMTG